tara:strand:- start:767 stop:913 length:147 start_codon:yes stop_codon:yes gene_type:complete
MTVLSKKITGFISFIDIAALLIPGLIELQLFTLLPLLFPENSSRVSLR